MTSIDDVRWSASRRLKSIAHLVDAAALAPETHYSSLSNSSMVSMHRPSRDGLRRTTTSQQYVEGRPEMQLHDSASLSAAADGDSAVTSLLPLPPQTNTPSQRPGTGELAVKSPRSLWHYVKALEKENAGNQYTVPDSRAPTPALSQFVDRGLPAPEPEPAEPLLHGLPPDYAVFCRERMAGSSRRLFFPPWVQRPEVGWEDAIHSFESHRWMWATLSQANRRRVLQLPQHEILSRAVSDGPETGGPSGFAMPPNCADLLAAYLPSEAFCRAVQELFLQSLLHGQALLPVHTLTKYSRGRIIRDERRRKEERAARDERETADAQRRARGKKGSERRNPLADPQRRRRRQGRRGGRRGARSLDASELNSSSVSSMSLLLEELESQRSHETDMGGTIGQSRPDRQMPDPSEEGALRLMTDSLMKAKPVDPKDAMRKHRYPWRKLGLPTAVQYANVRPSTRRASHPHTYPPIQPYASPELFAFCCLSVCVLAGMPFLVRGLGGLSGGVAADEDEGEQQISLSLTVHQASGIRAADRGGTSDPFVTAWLDGHETLTKAETAIKKKTLAPTWNETLLLRVPSGQGLGTTHPLPTLMVRMFDDDKLGKDFLGEVTVPAEVWSNAAGGGGGKKKMFKLEQRMDASKRQAKVEITGQVVLSFETTRVSLEIDAMGASASRPWTPSLGEELNASRSLLQDGMGRPARAPVGGRERGRCMCYCIRCDCYRDANEFFLWNIEQGQHCSDQDCPQCFRRGVRWCWLCVEEELAESPHTLAREVHEEKAAADECCALVHWLMFVLDERLHAAVGHPLHAAWGQPHGCNPLLEEQHERLEANLEELRLQHASLNHDWLFGCIEAPSQDRFDYSALSQSKGASGFGSTIGGVSGSNPMMMTARSGTSLRSPPRTARSMDSSRGASIRALATDKALPRSMATLSSSGVVDDAEMQLIMHTIDELTAGGANNAAKLGPDRAAHLAKLSRLMVRKIHQHSKEMGEHDTLVLTQKYLYLRRLLASQRGVPVEGDEAHQQAGGSANSTMAIDAEVLDDGSVQPVVEHTSLRMNNSGGALRAREAQSTAAHKRGLDEGARSRRNQTHGSSSGPSSPGSPSRAAELSASGLLPGLHPDPESLLDPNNQEDAAGADEVLWEDVGQSGTMGWEARRLMKTLRANQDNAAAAGGHGGGGGGSGLGEWAGAGNPALRVKGTERARTRVAQHSEREAIRSERRQTKENLWREQPTDVSADEKAALLRRRRQQQQQARGGGKGGGGGRADASAYHAAPWGSEPAQVQLGNQIKYGALMSASTWDKIV